MSTLLLKLEGNRTFNGTIFPPALYIYDDLLIYRKRRWFRVKEITISYNQIAQVILDKGIVFASIELETPSTEFITIRYLGRNKATLAKKIIDQKIYHSHAKHQPNAGGADKSEYKSYEKSLNRLRELVERGQLSESEYNKRRDALLRAIK